MHISIDGAGELKRIQAHIDVWCPGDGIVCSLEGWSSFRDKRLDGRTPFLERNLPFERAGRRIGLCVVEALHGERACGPGEPSSPTGDRRLFRNSNTHTRSMLTLKVTTFAPERSGWREHTHDLGVPVTRRRPHPLTGRGRVSGRPCQKLTVTLKRTNRGARIEVGLSHVPPFGCGAVGRLVAGRVVGVEQVVRSTPTSARRRAEAEIFAKRMSICVAAVVRIEPVVPLSTSVTACCRSRSAPGGSRPSRPSTTCSARS